jgi:hypothetical protein
MTTSMFAKRLSHAKSSAQAQGRASLTRTLLAALAIAGAGAAHAGCLNPNLAPSAATEAAAHFLPAVYRPAAQGPRWMTVADADEASIVGLWQFKFSGGLTDFGTQAWHADGTEIMFSMGPNPATGDVCQGVWTRVGPRTYALNHIAMGWAAPGADPANNNPFVRVHLHVVVTVDRSGDSFSGTYNADVYMETANDPFNEDPATNPPIASLSGGLTAVRVQPAAAPHSDAHGGA